MVKSDPFKKGGEGSIHDIYNSSNKCFKRYKIPIPAKSKRIDKLLYMIDNPPSELSGERFLICWPEQLVLNEQGDCVGYVMEKANNAYQLVEITGQCADYPIPSELRAFEVFSKNEKRNKANKGNLMKLCMNIAIAFYYLFQSDEYICQDIKPQNILISSGGTVTLVDLDSIQVRPLNSPQEFLTSVHSKDYIPPEILLKNLGKIATNISWDMFSLAVVFYQVLLSVHPYTGDAVDSNAGRNRQALINANLFPFGVNEGKVKPSSRNKKFYELPTSIRKLFIAAFDDKPFKRPNIEDWIKALHLVTMDTSALKQHDTLSSEGKNNEPIPHPEKNLAEIFLHRHLSYDDLSLFRCRCLHFFLVSFPVFILLATASYTIIYENHPLQEQKYIYQITGFCIAFVFCMNLTIKIVTKTAFPDLPYDSRTWVLTLIACVRYGILLALALGYLGCMIVNDHTMLGFILFLCIPLAFLALLLPLGVLWFVEEYLVIPLLSDPSTKDAELSSKDENIESLSTFKCSIVRLCLAYLPAFVLSSYVFIDKVFAPSIVVIMFVAFAVNSLIKQLANYYYPQYTKDSRAWVVLVLTPLKWIIGIGILLVLLGAFACLVLVSIFHLWRTGSQGIWDILPFWVVGFVFYMLLSMFGLFLEDHPNFFRKLFLGT